MKPSKSKETPEALIAREQLRRLKELKLKRLEALKRQEQHERKNKLIFFNHVGCEPDCEICLGVDKGYLGRYGSWHNNDIQERYFNALSKPEYKIFTLTGANRIAKTFSTSGCTALALCRGRFPWESKNAGTWLWDIRGWKPPIKIRIVGQDWEKHIRATIVPTLKELTPAIWNFDTKKNNVGVESMWTDPLTGSTIEIMTNKSESDLFEGWSGHAVIYDEPPKRDNRVACARGLIDHNGIEIFAMTLLKEAWVDREVIKARNEDGTPDTSVFNCYADISVNIGHGIDETGVGQFKKTLRPHEIDARIKGVPSYMNSLIYPQFRRELHIKPRPKRIPLDWMVDIAIDFHPSKPWAVLFMATDSRDFKYCIDEINENGSWKAIGEQIIRIVQRNSYRVNKIIIDPLSKGDAQSDLQEESVFDKMSMLFAAYGYTLYTANKDKEGGIHIVQDLLMTENEMPALFFCDHLARTIYEIEGYMRDENGKPSKEEDDMMENLYRLALLDTHYEYVEDDYEREESRSETVNHVTGY